MEFYEVSIFSIVINWLNIFIFQQNKYEKSKYVNNLQKHFF